MGFGEFFYAGDADGFQLSDLPPCDIGDSAEMTEMLEDPTGQVRPMTMFSGTGGVWRFFGVESVLKVQETPFYDAVEVQEAVERESFQFPGAENDANAIGKDALYVGQHL